MNPMKKFLAILLGATVLLGATIAFADDSATDEDSDEVSVEQVHDADESGAGEADVASADAPGQIVDRGDAWTGDYARGLEVATIARDGAAPAGMEAATTAGDAAATTSEGHGKSEEHTPDDSEG